MQKQKIIIEGKTTNYSIDTDGNVYNDKFNRILKGTDKRNEYRSVQLMIDGKAKTLMVHRLVAETFLPNPNNYSIVDHIDRDKTNNKLENLRWVNSQVNALNSEKNNFGKRIKFNPKILEQEDWKSLSIDENVKVNKKGQIINIQTGNILNGSKRNGYIRINIKGKYYSVHKIIWETFNGIIPENMVIDHIDGNKENNELINLRLVSQSDNMVNAQLLGHNGQVKISQYDLNGTFITTYNSIKQAAEAINGNEVAIKDAANRMGSSSGFLWIKENQNITIEEVLKIYREKMNKRTVKVSQYDKNNVFIKTYDSLAEASRAIGVKPSSIRKAINREGMCKNYYWKIVV